MLRLLFSVAVVLMVPGCKSRPLGPYTSPRVTGQVLAADTRQPLAAVRVTRGMAEISRGSPPKGGELLMRKPPAQTDQNGRFEFANERVLSILRGAGWNFVLLSFERAGYLRFETNCPTSAVTNTARREPVLDVGIVYLQPVH